MSAAGWITMIVIMGFVWGGFAMILATALRKEAGKNDATRR
jgi:hypothetical protein